MQQSLLSGIIKVVREERMVTMKLVFCGACHEVTGSCYYIEACNKKILVDYGLEQGVNVYESGKVPVPLSDIDYVFLTHAHIDHSGKLPLLAAEGFNGRIFSTVATMNLCGIMLQDSAHIQEVEAEWDNRKRRRAGKVEIPPLYTVEDALSILNNFEGYRYGEIISVCDGIQIRFIDAGHLLGSASIEIYLTENGVTKKLLFSGDIGNTDRPLIRNPMPASDADYIIMESTYGDREHGMVPDYVKSLSNVIRRTFERGGNVVIPSFAVGRTQEMLYYMRQIKDDPKNRDLGDFPVYLDSPLAIEATGIYEESANREYFDEEALSLLEKGIDPIKFSGLNLSITSEQSKEINFNEEPKVIISASGMCDAGRIKHHLKHNLWRPECTILFVGYQANGTLGRALTEGCKQVKIFGDEIDVEAEICQLSGLSAHADVNGLKNWISNIERKPERVFVCHGEDTVCDAFADRLSYEMNLNAMAPYPYASIDIGTGIILTEGNREKIKKKEKSSIVSPKSPYGRLLLAMKRLETVVKHNEGGANKDLAKFTDQLIALCDKWDR